MKGEERLQIKDYFPKADHPTLDQQLAQKCDRIIKKIQEGSIQIAQEAQNISYSKQRFQEITKTKLKSLQNAKSDILKRLSDLTIEEANYRVVEHNTQGKSLFRSEITKEQKEKIRKVLKEKQQYQNSLKKRLQDILVQINDKQIAFQQEKERKIQQKKNQRRLSLMEKRKKTEELKKRVQSLKKHQKKINPDDYSYIKNLKRDAKRLKEIQEYNNIVIHQKRERMKIDLRQVKKQAIRYDEILRNRKNESLNPLHKNDNECNYQETSFMKAIKIYQIQKKVLEKRKIDEKKELALKVKEYREHVREHFKPILNEKNTLSFKKKIQPLNYLSQKERYEQGNSFLQEAKRKGSKKPVTQGPSTEGSEVFISRYPNYLLDLKNRYRSSEEKKMEDMIRNKTLPHQKTTEAIHWVQKNQQKLKMNPSKNQYEAAKQKLLLLESILANEQQ